MPSVFRREIGYEVLSEFLFANGDDSKEASCAIPRPHKPLLKQTEVVQAKGHKQENEDIALLLKLVLPVSTTAEQKMELQDTEEEYIYAVW
jgi:hypothetical protein